MIRANRKFEWFVRIGLTRYKNRGFNCEWFARIDSRESLCESPVPLSRRMPPKPLFVGAISCLWILLGLEHLQISLSEELSGPVLRDTARLSQRYPSIVRYGVFGVSTWPIGCDTPSPFSERLPLGEHAKWRCDTPPPPSKGVSQRYLRDTLWKQGKWVRYPPLQYYLETVLHCMGGGISHWAAKQKNLLVIS